MAVVRTPNSVTPAQIASLESLLERRNGKVIELHVRSLLTKEATSKGYLHVIEPESDPVDVPTETPSTRPTEPPKGDLSIPDGLDDQKAQGVNK